MRISGGMNLKCAYHIFNDFSIRTSSIENVPKIVSTKRKYKSIKRNKCKIYHHRRIVALSAKRISSTRKQICCNLQHIDRMSHKFILQRRNFFWKTMNRTQRKDWIVGFLRGQSTGIVCFLVFSLPCISSYIFQ